MVLDELNQELTGLINRHGGRAIGLNSQDGRFIHARPLARDADDVDAGFVGDIAGVDVELVNLLLSRNFVPVVLPIGVGDDGAAYHVNSERVGWSDCARPRRREADPDDECRRRSRPQRQARVHPDCARGPDTARRAPRAGRSDPARDRRGARRSARACGGVRIIDGGVPSALMLEVLTADGVGTAVRSDAGPHFLEDSRAYLMDAGATG